MIPLKPNISSLSRHLFTCTLILAISHTVLYSQILSGSVISEFRIFKKGEKYTGATVTRLDKTAWKGERIINQLIIWTEGSAVHDIEYHLTDLTGVDDTISADNISLKFVHYVKADLSSKGCSEYNQRDWNAFDELGDVLSGSPITDLSPEDPVRIWLTIDVPIRIKAGSYKGALIIKSGGRTELIFDISLSVTDWTLPAREEWNFHLDLWQYPTRVIDRFNDAHPENKLAYWSEAHYALLRQMYRILADKGQKVITAQIKEGALGCPSMVRWIKSKDGSWKYDYSVFDQYIDSMISWGIREQISCHSPVGWNPDEIPFYDESTGEMSVIKAPVGSKMYLERWNYFLSDFRQHLREKGLFEKTVLCMDEIEEDKLAVVIGMIKNNDEEWKIGLAGFHQLPTRIDSNIYDLSLHYIIPFKYVDYNRISTFYFSCNPPHPNNFIASDAEPAGNIFIGWYAFYQHINGFLRWAYDNWLDSDPFEMRIGAHTSGDFCLIYRSSNEADMEFYSSIRLELIRDGIQDYEKLVILKDHLRRSSDPEDAISLIKLEDKLKEFSSTGWEPGGITSLIESGRELIREIITGN